MSNPKIDLNNTITDTSLGVLGFWGFGVFDDFDVG